MPALPWEPDNPLVCLKVDFLAGESVARKCSVSYTLNNGFLISMLIIKVRLHGFLLCWHLH